MHLLKPHAFTNAIHKKVQICMTAGLNESLIHSVSVSLTSRSRVYFKTVSFDSWQAWVGDRMKSVAVCCLSVSFGWHY